jgi:hypothetical protein
MVPPPNLRAMRSPRVVLGAVALAVVATLAACGGDDEEVTTEASTTSTSNAPTTTSSGGACAVPGATLDAKASPAAPSTPALLTNVRTGRQPCADRVVFDFDGQAPGFTVQYEPGPFTFGESGETITIDGSAFLVVRLSPASGVDLSSTDARETYTGPERITPSGLAHVREVRRLSDFEAQMVWVIGLDATRPFTVATLTSPTRVYLDIA